MKLHTGQAARRGRAFLLSSTTALISLAFAAGNATAQQAAALPNPAVQKPPTPAPTPAAQPTAKPTPPAAPAAKTQTAQATTPAPGQAAKPTNWKPTIQPQRTAQARTPVRSAAVQTPPEDTALRAIAVSPGRSITDTLAENGLAKAEIDSVMKTASAHLNAAELSKTKSIRLRMNAPDQAGSVQLFSTSGLLLDIERLSDGAFALKSAPGAAQGEESEKRFVSPTEGSIAIRGPSRNIVPASLSVTTASLASSGIGSATMRDAAAALASVAASSIDVNRATFQVTWGKTEDGVSKILGASVDAPNGRARVYWFAPSGMPEGFFDADGKRAGSGGFGEPIPGSYVASGFGYRGGVVMGRRMVGGFHNGLDIAGQFGTPIYAAADGVVNYQGWYYNYGRAVKITHTESLETLYAHMSRFADGVGPGSAVRKGDLIGYVGSTGRSTGPHLHFSVIASGEFVDPTGYLSVGQDRLAGADLVSFKRLQQQVDQAGRNRGGWFGFGSGSTGSGSSGSAAGNGGTGGSGSSGSGSSGSGSAAGSGGTGGSGGSGSSGSTAGSGSAGGAGGTGSSGGTAGNGGTPGRSGGLFGAGTPAPSPADSNGWNDLNRL